ncbi:unannotated protein [freshwater metagenome]|jgi:two-component system sensor histidine kinase SenX3|uniref:histidine kinase n=1 Tax=freshwater metagenome TaxID=449393 RepID=A0A6J7T099_9ZZZZ|nr:histidine kinase [Actinomycetota bacterium]MTB04642.1 histidine kinase [Actinomycetota bacterium]
MKFRRGDSSAKANRELPPMLVETLINLESEAFIAAPGEISIFATPGTEQLGILKDSKVQSPELIATIRVVRRTNKKQVGKIELPRGPIGEGIHELTVTVIPISEDDLVLVLVSDESEAQRVHEVRRDFVANISHELKTPIGALSLLSEAVLGAKDDPAAVTKFATRMQSESKRLTDLVQEIINLSKLQDSDPLQVAQELEIEDLISAAIDQSQITADNRQILVTHAESHCALVLGDREQLIMAIQNLVENAINYSPEGTKVAVTTTVENGIVEIAITDQGIGIPEGEIDRIFERFYRVDPARSRQTGGTGLGLSIVKHVASKHGGEVKVWSAPGVGSTFSLRLPVYIPSEEAQL